MKVNCGFCLIGFLATALFAQVPDTLWTRAYGGIYDERGNSVQQASDGGYIIAGYTDSLSAGDKHIYLIKTDSAGSILWERIYGGSYLDEAYSVQQTDDGGYIVVGTGYNGANYYDVYLLKLDTSGDTIWTKKIGGPGADVGYSVQQTIDGGYIIVGYTFFFVAEVYLIKTNAVGDTQWTKVYGWGIDDRGFSVQQTADRGYIVAGWREFLGSNIDVLLIKTNVYGDTVWTKTYSVSPGVDVGWSVQQTNDGGYIVAGSTFYSLDRRRDIYLIKTDARGDTLWTRMYGGTESDVARSVQQTFDGGYIVVGTTHSFDLGAGDVWLLKTDANGDTLWTATYGGTDWDEGYSVQQTFDGGYVIAGYTWSLGAGCGDVYLIKVGSDTLGIEENNGTDPKTQFLEAFPNPFREITEIRYQIPETGTELWVCLKVYDVTGRLRRTLVNESKEPGYCRVLWDGKDDSGKPVTSGIYFYRLEAGNFTSMRKLVVMR